MQEPFIFVFGVFVTLICLAPYAFVLLSDSSDKDE